MWLETHNLLIVSLTSIFAILMSVVSLFITLRFQHKIQIQNARPLCVYEIVGKGNELTLTLINAGCGPMHVSNCEILYKKNKVKNFHALFQDRGLQFVTFMERTYIGDYIPSNSEKELLKVIVSSTKDKEVMWNIIRDVSIQMSFEDIYNNKYEDNHTFIIETNLFFDVSGVSKNEL